jgi:CRISPR-associated endonuclease Csy4
MDHYLDIRVLDDPEFSAQQLLNALFAKLHRTLALISAGQIGVSFPAAAKTLGGTLRLHGAAAALSALQSTFWFKGLRDYTQVGEILPVPDNAKFRIVKRIQVKSSVERLRRRSVKKGWLTEEQAAVKISATTEKRTNLPFLEVKSTSTGQLFKLFISQGPILSAPSTGEFSAYGLSATGTIPWF